MRILARISPYYQLFFRFFWPIISVFFTLKTGNVLNNKAQFERFDKMGAKAQKSGKSLHSMVISISKFEKKIQFWWIIRLNLKYRIFSDLRCR